MVSQIKRAWAKKLEEDGFNVSVDHIYYDEVQGASFAGKVDVIRFLNKHDPNDTRFPRSRDIFKNGDYEIEIINDDGGPYPYAMRTEVINRLDETKTDDDSVGDLMAEVLEPGNILDRVAELSDWILTTARDYATEMHKEMKDGKGK
jgi:hypothetical protein